MKKYFLLLFGMLMLCTAASAQVKTYRMVTEDETKVVNASDCYDHVGNYYLLWVRYDYTDKKALKTDAKRDHVSGKPVRAEILYQFDDCLLSYRIITKRYYNKKEEVIKEVNYHNAAWNGVCELDYSLKLGIYMTGFGIAAG